MRSVLGFPQTDRSNPLVDQTRILAHAEIEFETDVRIGLIVPTTTPTYEHEQRLRLEPAIASSSPRDARLVDLIARAFASREQLLGLSDAELDAMPVTQHRHLERTARLAFLAPDIVRAIVDGRQPKSLSARELARLGSLSLSWSEQRAMLGFVPA